MEAFMARRPELTRSLLVIQLSILAMAAPGSSFLPCVYYVFTMCLSWVYRVYHVFSMSTLAMAAPGSSFLPCVNRVYYVFTMCLPRVYHVCHGSATCLPWVYRVYHVFTMSILAIADPGYGGPLPFRLILLCLT